jgi:hypothetical protein
MKRIIEAVATAQPAPTTRKGSEAEGQQRNTTSQRIGKARVIPLKATQSDLASLACAHAMQLSKRESNSANSPGRWAMQQRTNGSGYVSGRSGRDESSVG